MITLKDYTNSQKYLVSANENCNVMNECVFVVMVLVAGCVGAILPFVIFAVVLALKKETNVTEIKEGGALFFPI